MTADSGRSTQHRSNADTHTQMDRRSILVVDLSIHLSSLAEQLIIESSMKIRSLLMFYAARHKSVVSTISGTSTDGFVVFDVFRHIK